MVRKVEIPFSHVDELQNEYGNKFLVLTNCNTVDRIWGKAGILRAVCDTYPESLDACIEFYADEEAYGEVRDFHFRYVKGVTKGDFRYQ